MTTSRFKDGLYIAFTTGGVITSLLRWANVPLHIFFRFWSDVFLAAALFMALLAIVLFFGYINDIIRKR